MKKRRYVLPIVLVLLSSFGVSGCRSKLPDNYVVGYVTGCQATPEFLADLGFIQPAMDTTQRLATGLIIREMGGNNRVYQHPTWDDAGNVGPFARDHLGNLYLAPTPLVSLQLNPPEEQNKIYRVDSQTGEMSLFFDLPWNRPYVGGNPYGAVGLAYDCETNALYAASIAGSTAQDEWGSIYQINLDQNQIVSQFDGVDAIGIGVFNGRDGKRLYYGAARTPELYSIPLDAGGKFNGPSRLEFSLALLPGGSYDTAHRILFTVQNQMIIMGIEFSYSLQVASDPQRNVYTFDFNQEENSWELFTVQRQSP